MSKMESMLKGKAFFILCEEENKNISYWGKKEINFPAYIFYIVVIGFLCAC